MVQLPPPTSSLPKPTMGKDEVEDGEEGDKKAIDKDAPKTNDPSSINDDLELSDDEMDKDSGSSNDGNETGYEMFTLFMTFMSWQG